MSFQQHAPAAFYPRERTGTHFPGGWVGPRAGLDGRKISSPPGFDPGTSSPMSVAIPTELPSPQLNGTLCENVKVREPSWRWEDNIRTDLSGGHPVVVSNDTYNCRHNNVLICITAKTFRTSWVIYGINTRQTLKMQHTFFPVNIELSICKSITLCVTILFDSRIKNKRWCGSAGNRYSWSENVKLSVAILRHC